MFHVSKTIHWMLACFILLAAGCVSNTTEMPVQVEPLAKKVEVRPNNVEGTANNLTLKEKISQPNYTQPQQEFTQKPILEDAQANSLTQQQNDQSAESQKTKVVSTPLPLKIENPNSVYISILGDSQKGFILPLTPIEYKKGDTVLSVLQRATRERKIQMEFRGRGSAAYVEGIDNLYEFDLGPKSGWVYRVNQEMGKKSAGAYEIKPGDRVEWLYTMDLGKDLGDKKP